jgi:hypothetical protein
MQYATDNKPEDSCGKERENMCARAGREAAIELGKLSVSNW